MAIFTFAAPDGKEYDIEAPEGATQEEALDYLVSNWDTLSATSQESAKVNEPVETPVAQTPEQPVAEQSNISFTDKAYQSAKETAQAFIDSPIESIRKTAYDRSLALSKGLLSVPEFITGIADMASNGQVGKYLEDKGVNYQTAKEYLTSQQSPEERAAAKEREANPTFSGTVESMLTNPSSTVNAALESLPASYVGGRIGSAVQGIKALGKASGMLGAGAGELIVGSGQAEEGIRQQTPDRLTTPEQSALALGAGTADAFLAGIGSVAAKKLGIADIDTLRAGARSAETSIRDMAKQILGSMGIEGGEELTQSAAEQIIENYALDKPSLFEGVPNAAATGMITGMAMGGGHTLTSTIGESAQTVTGGKPQQAPIDTTQTTEQATPTSDQTTSTLQEYENIFTDENLIRKGNAPVVGSEAPIVDNQKIDEEIGKTTNADDAIKAFTDIVEANSIGSEINMEYANKIADRFTKTKEVEITDKDYQDAVQLEQQLSTVRDELAYRKFQKGYEQAKQEEVDDLIAQEINDKNQQLAQILEQQRTARVESSIPSINQTIENEQWAKTRNNRNSVIQMVFDRDIPAENIFPAIKAELKRQGFKDTEINQDDIDAYRLLKASPTTPITPVAQAPEMIPPTENEMNVEGLIKEKVEPVVSEQVSPALRKVDEWVNNGATYKNGMLIDSKGKKFLLNKAQREYYLTNKSLLSVAKSPVALTEQGYSETQQGQDTITGAPSFNTRALKEVLDIQIKERVDSNRENRNLSSVNQRIEEQQWIRTRNNRNAAIQTVFDKNVSASNIESAIKAELKRQGFKDTELSEDDINAYELLQSAYARRNPEITNAPVDIGVQQPVSSKRTRLVRQGVNAGEQVTQGQQGQDVVTNFVEPSTPVRQDSDSLRKVDEWLRNGATYKNGMLIDSKGKKFLLNKAQREYYLENRATSIAKAPVDMGEVGNTPRKRYMGVKQQGVNAGEQMTGSIGQDQISGVEESPAVQPVVKKKPATNNLNKITGLEPIEVAIGKLGGINREMANRAGFSDFKGRYFTKTSSEGFDGMALRLADIGYDVDGENDLIAKLRKSLDADFGTGKKVYTPQGLEHQMALEQAEEFKAFEAEQKELAKELLKVASGNPTTIDEIQAAETPEDFDKLLTNIVTLSEDEADDFWNSIGEENADQTTKDASITTIKENAPEILSTYTEQEVTQREEAQKAAEKEQAVKDAAAERKRQADNQVDSVVDEMLGRGMTTTKDIFAPERKPKFSKAKAQERLAPNGKPSNLNATQYEQVRTPEFKAWFGDWENDPENASKVVDENGEPLVVYHGANYPEFTAFETYGADYTKTEGTGAFFTDSKELADSYIDAEYPSAFPAIYGTYLNIKNPNIIDFNGDNWSDHNGMSTDEYVRETRNANENDGSILKNVNDAGVSGYDIEANVYAVFNPNQIKSATGNTGEFSKESNDIRFSKAAKKVLDDNPLAIVHNLNLKNLAHADKMGGLPAPSIAVVNQKYPLSDFGEITLIGDTSQFAPEADKANRFYNADVYSPRYPNVTYTVDSKAVSNANEALSDDTKVLANAIGRSGLIDKSSIEDKGLVDGLGNNLVLQYEFLKTIGKAPKMQYKPNKVPPANMKKFIASKVPAMELKNDPNFIQAVVDNHNESVRKRNEILNQNRPYLEVESQQASNLAVNYQYDIEEFRNQKGAQKSIDTYATSKLIREKTNRVQYEKWLVENYSNLITDERIFNGFTNAGNRIYLPHNLDTVVKLMTKTVKGGENVSYGIGTIRAHTAKQFKTVKAIQAARGDIVSAEKLEALKEELSNEFENLSEELRPYSDYSNPSATDALSDLVSKGTRAFKESYQDVPAETMTKVYDFLDKLKNMPAHYFEAKIGRAVKLNEFAGALVPKGKEYDEAVKILNANGITKIKRYTENDSQSRSDALLNFSELLFSQVQEPTVDNHTEQSLKEGLTQAGDNAYGKGWTDRLLVTGMFEFISDADAQAIVEEAAEVSYSKNGDIEAFFNPAEGKTYFVAENIDKATDLHYLMMHEVGVHALNMGGNKEEFESILKQVDNLVKVKNPAAMQGRQDALDADTPQEDLREETLAYLLKYAPKLKVVERFKAWLKNTLRNMSKMFPASQKLGFIQWANKLSDQDLLYIANATLRKAPEMLGTTTAGQQKSIRASYAGEKASGADKSALAKAVEMEQQGVDGDTIRQKTGWFLGMDDKWRFEISDNKVKLKDFMDESDVQKVKSKENVSVFLIDLIDHPKLFESYPDLEMVLVSITPSLKPNRNAYFNQTLNRIGIDAPFNMKYKLQPSLSTLMHEVQHAIQRKEGFAIGGAPSLFNVDVEMVNQQDYLNELDDEIKAAHQQRLAVGDKSVEFDALNEKWKSLMAEKYKVQKMSPDEYIHYYKYERLAGEIEARDSADRLKLTDKKRKELPPYSLQGIAKKDAIVRFEGQNAYDSNKKSFMFSKNALSKNPDGTFNIPAESSFQFLRKWIQDDLLRIRVVMDRVREQGGKVDESNDVVLAMEAAGNIAANQLEKLKERYIQPLIDRMAKMNVNKDEIGLLLYAKHAPERNAYIQSINPKFRKLGEGGSGMTDAESAAIIQRYKETMGDKYAEFEKLTDDWQNIQTIVKNILVASGDISPEQAQSWEDGFDYHVPLKGFEEVDEVTGKAKKSSRGNIGQGFSISGKFDRKMLGRQSRANQIVENIVMNLERAVIRSSKMYVQSTLYKLVGDNPDINLWENEVTPMKPIMGKAKAQYVMYFHGSEIGVRDTLRDARRYVEAETARTGQEKREYEIVKVGGEPQVTLMRKPYDQNEEISYWRNGKQVRIVVNDEAFVQAFNRLGDENIYSMFKVMAAFNRFLRHSYTILNPAFIIANGVMVDPAVALYTNTARQGFKYASTVLAKTPMASLQIAKYMAKGSTSNAEWDNAIRLYYDNGGKSGAAFISSIEQKADELNLAVLKSKILDTKFYEYPLDKLKLMVVENKLANLLKYLGEVGETATRLSTFKVAIDNGKSPQEAAKIARNVTINFNRRGVVGRELGAMYLFLNASIQGTENLVDATINGEHKVQAAAMLSTYVTLGYLIALLGGDDGDDDLIPEEEKTRFLSVTLDEKTGLRVDWKLPYGLSFWKDVGTAIARVQLGGDPEKITNKLMSSFFNNFSYVNPMVSGEWNAKDLISGLIPTAGRIPYSIYNNRNQWGKPIYPEDTYKTTVPDSEKEWSTTRGTLFSDFAKWMNKVTGGTKVESGLIDVSPESMKYTLNALTGSVGTQAYKFLNSLYTSSMNAEEMSVGKLPLVSNFVKEDTVDAYRRVYTTQRKEAKDIYDKFKKYEKLDDEAATDKFVTRHQSMLDFYDETKSIIKEVEDLRDKQDEARIEGDKQLLKELENDEKELLIEYNYQYNRR